MKSIKLADIIYFKPKREEGAKTDIKKLIEILLSDEKLSDSIGGTTYRDTPILRPASQMENYLPPKCAEMKQMAKNSGAVMRPVELFFRQAVFMADYEDDFEYTGHYYNYFPTYRTMSDAQLRGYFTWRTRLRHGEYGKGCESFVFVYIYELLHLIGVESAEAGFETIDAVWKHYRGEYNMLDSYVPGWLTDFAAYYNLPPSLVSEYGNADFFRHFNVLYTAKGSDDEIFEAMCALSNYDIKRSRLYKAEPELVAAACTAMFRGMEAYYSDHSVQTFTEACCGRVTNETIRIFSSAVFFDRRSDDDYSYVLNEAVTYRFKGGVWTKTGISYGPKKSSKLGSFMKQTDCILRRKLGFSHQMKGAQLSARSNERLEKLIDNFFAEKKKAEAPVINIDLSLLSGIRASADLTRDMLTVEEDDEEAAEEVNGSVTGPETEPETETETGPEPPAVQPEDETPACAAGLNETETALVRCLLRGGDCAALMRSAGAMLSVTVDSVNEKLFDYFGDTVVGFDGDTPYIIEDYEDELKEMI